MTLSNPTKTCVIEQCTRLPMTRGLCDNHYHYRVRLGFPQYATQTLSERFWAKVERRGDNECWPWKNGTNYGTLSVDGRMKRSTHVSLFLHTGRWPTMLVLHSCDYPPCVNPKHLREGTQGDNMKEAAKRLRFPHGERASFAKLTNAQAAEIRQRSTDGEAIKSLALEFGVAFNTIWNIREGTSWTKVLNTQERPRKRPMYRLDAAQRSELESRVLSDDPTAKIAREFGVSWNAVWRLRKKLKTVSEVGGVQ